MKICIDIDDYHSYPKWDCSDVLERLISKFPTIRFTLFLTPFMEKIPLTDYPQAIEKIGNMIAQGNVEIFPHGLTHTKIIKGEFGVLPKRFVKKRVLFSKSLIEKASLPCKEGFKFPWHIYNDASIRALEDLNYTFFTNKAVKNFRGEQIVWKDSGNVGKRYIQTEEYRYGKSRISENHEIVYYHGHAQNMRKNGIRESYKNLLNELDELSKIGELEYIFCSQIKDNVRV